MFKNKSRKNIRINSYGKEMKKIILKKFLINILNILETKKLLNYDTMPKKLIKN